MGDRFYKPKHKSIFPYVIIIVKNLVFHFYSFSKRERSNEIFLPLVRPKKLFPSTKKTLLIPRLERIEAERVISIEGYDKGEDKSRDPPKSLADLKSVS